MKKLLSILLLIVYVSILFRPIYPYLEYAINKDYIAQVLCINKDEPVLQCDGKCHLKKEIEKANDSNENSDSSVPSRKISIKETLFTHLTVNSSKSTDELTTKNRLRSSSFLNEYEVYIDIEIPPPNFS